MESYHTDVRQKLAEIDRSPAPLPNPKDIELADLVKYYGRMQALEYFEKISDIFSGDDFSIQERFENF